MSTVKSWPKRNSIELVNPFEEINKFKLEQSILSPNLFQVTSITGSRRDKSSIWNIDQRAILYPADIPTDDHSLLNQCQFDYKLNKNVNAAVEAFWSKTQTLIESPAANTVALKVRMKSKNSAFNSPIYDHYHATIMQKLKNNRDGVMMHPDFDINMLDDQEMLMSEEEEDDDNENNEDPQKKELNTSIRKKLFDQNDNDDFLMASPKSDSPVSDHRRDSLGYRNQFSCQSPRQRHVHNSNEVNIRTPDLSPFLIRNKQTDRLRLHGQYSPSPQRPHRQHHTHQKQQQSIDDFMDDLNSPQLSPIKDKQLTL